MKKLRTHHDLPDRQHRDRPEAPQEPTRRCDTETPTTARDAAAVLHFLGLRFGCAFGLARTTMTPGMSILLWSAGGEFALPGSRPDGFEIVAHRVRRAAPCAWYCSMFCAATCRLPVHSTAGLYPGASTGLIAILRLSCDSVEPGPYRVELSFCAFRRRSTNRKVCRTGGASEPLGTEALPWRPGPGERRVVGCSAPGELNSVNRPSILCALD